MSILIKGMKMPENCINCPMQFGGMCYVMPAEVDESRVAPTVEDALKQGKPDWCPLVGVPESHGDLIDREAPEIVHCGECAYYDPPHVKNNGVRYEYTEMPADAFDVLGTGLVTTEYGINIGGRCTRDYNTGYDDDKRVYVPENNYCGRAERRTDGQG